MGLFEGVKRGYNITIASMKVVLKEPWMIILPIITGIALIAIFLGIIFFPVSVEEKLSNPLFYISIIVYFFFSYFCLYFVQAMIIVAAARRFSGKDPSIGQAFSEALSHIGKIFLFSIIAAIVGLISELVSQKGKDGGNIVGQIAGGIIGFGWTLASYFSLPIILQEKTGVIESFKRSWDIINKCWGEVAGGNASMLIFFIPGFLLLLIGGILMNLWVILIGFMCLIIAMILLTPVNAVLSQALYTYATTKKVPTGFEADQIKGFFKQK